MSPGRDLGYPRSRIIQPLLLAPALCAPRMVPLTEDRYKCVSRDSVNLVDPSGYDGCGRIRSR
jgi:hypothetical protein